MCSVPPQLGKGAESQLEGIELESRLLTKLLDRVLTSNCSNSGLDLNGGDPPRLGAPTPLDDGPTATEIAAAVSASGGGGGDAAFAASPFSTAATAAANGALATTYPSTGAGADVVVGAAASIGATANNLSHSGIGVVFGATVNSSSHSGVSVDTGGGRASPSVRVKPLGLTRGLTWRAAATATVVVPNIDVCSEAGELSALPSLLDGVTRSLLARSLLPGHPRCAPSPLYIYIYIYLYIYIYIYIYIYL